MQKFLQTFSSGGPTSTSGNQSNGGRPGSPNRPGGSSRRVPTVGLGRRAAYIRAQRASRLPATNFNGTPSRAAAQQRANIRLALSGRRR